MTNRFETIDGKLHITVWPDGKNTQIEIYSRRGQSHVTKGENAIELAKWLKANFVDPILGKDTDSSVTEAWL